MHNKIQIFAEKMQIELDNNSHKGNWEDFTDYRVILKEFGHHYNKVIITLKESMNDIAFENLMTEHIADCANILMFLGNSFNLYNKK